MHQSEARNRKISTEPLYSATMGKVPYPSGESKIRIVRKSPDPYWKSNRISITPSAWGKKKKENNKPPSILDEDLKAEIDRLSSDSSDTDSDEMDHFWTVIGKKEGRIGSFPHVSESRIQLFGDEIRQVIWEYVRDHARIPMAFKKATDAYQRFVSRGVNN